jgi:hypothetical protein
MQPCCYSHKFVLPCRTVNLVSCYHILYFRCSCILRDVVSSSLSCYQVYFHMIVSNFTGLTCFCFIIMCHLLLQDGQRAEVWLVFHMLLGKFYIPSSNYWFCAYFAKCSYLIFFPLFLQAVPHSVLRFGGSCTSTCLQRKISHVSFFLFFHSFYLTCYLMYLIIILWQ